MAGACRNSPGYVASDNLTPYDTDVTDSDGVASFPNTTDPLEHGLYLVIGGL